jgi:hypothetical protein
VPSALRRVSSILKNQTVEEKEIESGACAPSEASRWGHREGYLILREKMSKRTLNGKSVTDSQGADFELRNKRHDKICPVNFLSY